MDYLGPALSLCLRLCRHHAFHLLGELNLFNLHGGDLDAPGVGVLVDNLLKHLVEPLPLGEQLIKLGLAEDIAQGGLGYLGGGSDMVQDLDHGALRVNYPEVNYGVHPDGDIVLGDYLLVRDIHGDDTQVYLHHPVHEGDDEEQAGALGADQASQAEDDAALVLSDDLNPRRYQYSASYNDGDYDSC